MILYATTARALLASTSLVRRRASLKVTPLNLTDDSIKAIAAGCPSLKNFLLAEEFSRHVSLPGDDGGYEIPYEVLNIGEQPGRRWSRLRPLDIIKRDLVVSLARCFLR